MSEYRIPEEDTPLKDQFEQEEGAEGVGGAEEGLSPLDDESYSDDPEGPSQVAGD